MRVYTERGPTAKKLSEQVNLRARAIRIRVRVYTQRGPRAKKLSGHLYTSDVADDLLGVDPAARRNIKKKNNTHT